MPDGAPAGQPLAPAPEPDVPPWHKLLSGIRDRAMFERLRDHLRASPDEPITSEDYERAADCLNICRAQGIQASNTDFLMCAVAERVRSPIFTADDDVVSVSRVLPVRLHRPAQGPQP
jgi:hypothetical protein